LHLIPNSLYLPRPLRGGGARVLHGCCNASLEKILEQSHFIPPPPLQVGFTADTRARSRKRIAAQVCRNKYDAHPNTILDARGNEGSIDVEMKSAIPARPPNAERAQKGEEKRKRNARADRRG